MKFLLPWRLLPALFFVASSTGVLAQPAKTAPPAGGSAKPLAATAPWPTKPIRLLIGFPAGSVQDLSARAFADPLSRALGQPVIVENKAGASGTIAADQVAKSSDMHTFGVMNNSQLTIAKMLNPAIGYDPAKDLAPIALIGTTPLVMVVSNAVPGKTAQEFLSWLQLQGNKANYGSPGAGTPAHLGMELVKSRSGRLTTQHVPYPGNPQLIAAMIGGQVQAALLPPGLAMQQVRAGNMKVIGVTSDKRSMLAPDMPTLREVGISGADMELFTALAGPASLPPAVVDKFGAAVIEVLKSDEVRQRLITVGWQPAPSTAEGVRTRMRNDTRVLGGIILMYGIKSNS